jgi:hypothetical protein
MIFLLLLVFIYDFFCFSHNDLTERERKKYEMDWKNKLNIFPSSFFKAVSIIFTSS